MEQKEGNKVITDLTGSSRQVREVSAAAVAQGVRSCGRGGLKMQARSISVIAALLLDSGASHRPHSSSLALWSSTVGYRSYYGGPSKYRDAAFGFPDSWRRKGHSTLSSSSSNNSIIMTPQNFSRP